MNETAILEEAPAAQDKVIWRPDLCEKMGVCSETVRRWINAGRLPKPDVHITAKTMGWKTSTLKAAGIGIV